MKYLFNFLLAAGTMVLTLGAGGPAISYRWGLRVNSTTRHWTSIREGGISKGWLPEASVPAAGIYDYERHWQADRIIPLSANVQWIVYSNGKDCLVRILLNEREVSLPLHGVGGPFYRWEDLRRYCIQRLRAVGADLRGNMLGYLKEVK